MTTGNRMNGRRGEIRTPDPLLPKQMRYQAALHAECITSTTFVQVVIHTVVKRLKWLVKIARQVKCICSQSRFFSAGKVLELKENRNFIAVCKYRFFPRFHVNVNNSLQAICTTAARCQA